MKQTNRVLALLLAMACVLCISACSNSSEPEDVWANAAYTENTTLGNGATTVYVKVKTDEKSITFTLKTDKTNLGDVLAEHNLVAGEEGDYGLYIKTVNGILADYDVDKTYWGFYQNGEYMMTGVDSTEFKDGEHYELVKSKG